MESSINHTNNARCERLFFHKLSVGFTVQNLVVSINEKHWLLKEGQMVWRGHTKSYIIAAGTPLSLTYTRTSAARNGLLTKAFHGAFSCCGAVRLGAVSPKRTAPCDFASNDTALHGTAP